MHQDPAPPLSDGRYRLLQVLGVGGMATVYRAQDLRLGVGRAIKVLSPQFMESTSLRKRFLAEARTMARLHHPAIVTVHDVGVDDERAFMVMELMEGGNLVDVLRRDGPLQPGQALAMVDTMLAGLEEAHAQGIIHRDLKPANLLLTAEGEVRICDFGIARITTENLSLTRTGSVLGTFGYMAPEQRNSSKTVDARADLFSVAASLYAVLTGREPVDLFIHDRPDPALAAIDPEINAYIRRGTAYNPAERWPDAAAMRADLAPLLERFPAEPLDPVGLPPLEVGALLTSDEETERVVAELRAPRRASAPPSPSLPPTQAGQGRMGRKEATDFGVGIVLVLGLAVGAWLLLAWLG